MVLWCHSDEEVQVLNYLLMMEPISREEAGRDFSDLGEGKASRILERLAALGFVVGDQILKVTAAGVDHVFTTADEAEESAEEEYLEGAGDRRAIEEGLCSAPGP